MPDPDNPTPYLSTEQQYEASMAIDRIAQALAQELTGTHLDDVSVTERARRRVERLWPIYVA